MTMSENLVSSSSGTSVGKFWYDGISMFSYFDVRLRYLVIAAVTSAEAGG